MFDGRGHDHRIHPNTVEQMLKVGHRFNVRIKGSHVLQPGFTEIAHRFKIAVGQSLEVASQIGTPITASDDTHVDRFCQLYQYSEDL